MAFESPELRRRFEELRAKAEDYEQLRTDFKPAADLFANVRDECLSPLESMVPDPHGGVLAQGQSPEGSEEIYLKILLDYSDLYTLAHRAYGTVAGLALAELASRSDVSRRAVDDVFSRLVEGHWGHSADAVDFFRRAFGALIPTKPLSAAAQRNLAQLASAQALAASGFKPRPLLEQ